MHFSFVGRHLNDRQDFIDLNGIDFKDPAQPDTHLSDLSNPHNRYQQNPAVNMGEMCIHPKLFEYAYQNLQAADDNVAHDMPQKWDAIRIGIQSAVQTFLQGLQMLDSSADPWEGATHDAALQNVYASLDIPSLDIRGNPALGAGALSTLNDAFSKTLATIKSDIVPNYPSYKTALTAYPQHHDDIVTQYDGFARKALQSVYNPNISAIANGNPGFDPGPLPSVGGANGGPGFGGGGGGPGPVGGRSIPAMTIPNFTPPDTSITPQALTAQQIPTNPSVATASPTSGQSGLDALASPLQSLASPLQSLASPLQSAVGQAQPGRGSTGALAGAGKLPPEGVLRGLGPKGLKGPGAAGGGAGLRGAPPGKSGGAPAAAVGNTTGRNTVAAGMRSGLGSGAGSGMGAPGAAGAPAAGHQGPGGQGAPHQPSKALRRKKNGEQLIGDAQAVVAVLGEPARPETPKPEAT